MKRSLLLISLLLSGASSLSACGESRDPGGAKGRDLGGFLLPSDDLARSVDLRQPGDDEDLASGDVDLASGPGCGSVTYAGYCTGDVVTWCENNAVESFDCTDIGKACTVVMGDADCR